METMIRITLYTRLHVFIPLYFYVFPDLKVLGFYCLHCLFGHKVHDPQVVTRKQ